MLDLIDPRTGERRLRLRAARAAGSRSVRVRRRRVPPERPRPAHAAGGRQRAGRSGLAGVPRRRRDRSADGSACRWAATRPASTRPRPRTAGGCSSRAGRTTGPGSWTRSGCASCGPGRSGTSPGPSAPMDGSSHSAPDTGRIRLLDLTSGRVRPMEDEQRAEVSRMRFTPDGRTLVTSGQDGQVLAWDVDRRSIAQRFAGHSRAVDGLDLTADGRTLSPLRSTHARSSGISRATGGSTVASRSARPSTSRSRRGGSRSAPTAARSRSRTVTGKWT